jgi:Protein of unknown function (DUF2815)
MNEGNTMSQTQQIQIPPMQPDPYLIGATMPQQDLTVDPQYHNVKLITPIGRLAHVRVDKPYAIQQANRDPSKPAEPKFSATLMMHPPLTMDIYNSIVKVADAHWPAVQRVDPGNPGIVITVPGSHMLGVPEAQGGYHYPLRSGDEAFAASTKPLNFVHYRGLMFINTSMSPRTKKGGDQRPVCLDELGNLTDPARFYPGCYARLKIAITWFSNSGNNGVTCYLEAIQFAKHGERIAMGFDQEGAARSAFAAVGALPVAQPLDLAASGPHTAGPGSVPAGFAPAGFAPPPPQQQPAQPVQQWGAPQPQQPMQPQQQPVYTQPVQQPQPQQPVYAQPQPQPGYVPPQQGGAWQPQQPAPGGPRPPGV